MNGDPVLRMLKDLRTEVIHQRPVHLAVYSGSRPHETPTTTTRLEITHVPDSEGSVTWRYRFGRDGEEKSAEAITDWEFKRDGRSVLAAWEHGLNEVGKLLRNWHEIFEKGAQEVKYTFTLHSDAWLRAGPVPIGGEVTGYKIAGCPMASRQGSQILERPSGKSGGFSESMPTTHRATGPASTPAPAELQKEFE